MPSVTPKVIELLSYFDEDSEMLVKQIHAASKFVDAVVAVDGRYALYPSETNRSPIVQRQAIDMACDALGLEILHHGPLEPWADERTKREAMFRLGELISTPDDWFFVIDADTELALADVTKDELAAVQEDVITVAHFDHLHDGKNIMQPFRSMFRAQRGIWIDTNHYTYRASDGSYLWADARKDLVKAADFTGRINLNHLNCTRAPERAAASMSYYSARDESGIERGQCEVCDQAKAVRSVPISWERSGEGLIAGWSEVCDGCVAGVKKRTFKKIRAMGFDPERLEVQISPSQPRIRLGDIFNNN